MYIQYYALPFSKDVNISRLLDENLIKDFHSSVSAMSKSTAEQYLNRLNNFNVFLKKEFNDLTINNLVNKIKEGSVDPYSFLSRYCGYLRNDGNISTITIKQGVVTVKNFF